MTAPNLRTKAPEPDQLNNILSKKLEEKNILKKNGVLNEQDKRKDEGNKDTNTNSIDRNSEAPSYDIEPRRKKKHWHNMNSHNSGVVYSYG